MPQPVLTATAQRMYDAIAPLVANDEANGWAAAHFCAARAAMFDEVANLSEPLPGKPTWSRLVDPDTCPAKFLPWLGQFVGVVPAPRLTEAEQRNRVKNAAGFRRGSVAALKGAPAPYLTGTKTVFFIERHGSPYKLTVSTLASETTDVAKVRAALNEQKPAGIVLTYATVTGGDYQSLKSAHLDYADIKLDFADYLAVRTNPLFT
jgi:hypothetical protein